MKRFSSFVIVASIVAALAGCGSSGSMLSGSVTYDGAPVAKGHLTLQPVDGKGSVVGAEIVDGKYTARDVPTGKVKATVASSGSSAGPISSGDAATAKPAGGNEIPPNAQGNGVEIDIKGGSQTHDFALTKPAS